MTQLSDPKKAMKGIFCVQMTPFNKDGSVDLEGMRANTKWLLERMAGKDFVFVPEGSNGEFYAQSEDEWKAVVKVVVEEVNGKLPVIVGAAQCGTQETIKRCRYAQSVGADGVMIVLPYYWIPTEEGMYQHYKQVAESIDIGVVLYNNPGVAGSLVRPPLMAKLSKIPNIIGVKEGSQSILHFNLMQKLVDPKDTIILWGRGEEMFPYVAPTGCPGFTSWLANFAPELAYSMYEAAMARDFDKVAELANHLSPFFREPEMVRCLPSGSNFLNKVTANHWQSAGVSGGAPMQFAVVKAAMDIAGLRGGEVRLPMVGLTKEEKDELAGILRNSKIIK